MTKLVVVVKVFSSTNLEDLPLSSEIVPLAIKEVFTIFYSLDIEVRVIWVYGSSSPRELLTPSIREERKSYYSSTYHKFLIISVFCNLSC